MVKYIYLSSNKHKERLFFRILIQLLFHLKQPDCRDRSGRLYSKNKSPPLEIFTAVQNNNFYSILPKYTNEENIVNIVSWISWIKEHIRAQKSCQPSVEQEFKYQDVHIEVLSIYYVASKKTWKTVSGRFAIKKLHSRCYYVSIFKKY